VTWLRELQSAQAQARRYGHVSLAQLQGWSELPAGTGLFDSIVVFENYPINEDAADAHGLGLRELRAVEYTSYPLALIVSPGEQLLVEIGYDPELFDAATIGQLAAGLRHVLRCFADDPDANLDRIDLPDSRHGAPAPTAGTGDDAAPEGGPDRTGHVPPRTDTEQVMARIWAEALDVPRVGVEDDFFLLGGDSLFSLAITAKVNAVFDVALTPRDVLTGRTISALAELVEEKVLRELEQTASGTEESIHADFA
jgi:acyl carrier protein